MKQLICAVKNFLINHTPYITIWTVTVQDRKTYVEIERLMFLRYSSAKKVFDELCELSDEDAKNMHWTIVIFC